MDVADSPIPHFPIAEYLPEPIFILHEDTHKIFWINSAAELWLRRSSRAVTGLMLTGFSPDFDTLAMDISRRSQMGGAIHGHDMSIRLAGKRNFTCSYVVFSCPSGIVIKVMPKPTTQSVHTHADNEQAVTMLGRMLAHELKNPLAGIHGAAQLLESSLHNQDDLELTVLIKTEVGRIGRLADQMENFGTTNGGENALFNVHTILRNAKLLFQSQDNSDIKLVEDYDPSLPDVFGNADALMQVVVNLIANAVEAINKGNNDGARCIEIKTLYRTGVTRRLGNRVHRSLPVEIRIIDNGPGIDVNLRERIFHPFVTSKSNGYGLGLALVSKIISEHEGLIDVQSQSGCTVFSILLPIADNIRSKD